MTYDVLRVLRITLTVSESLPKDHGQIYEILLCEESELDSLVIWSSYFHCFISDHCLA